MVIGKGEGVVAVLSILDEGRDYIVREFGCQGGVCEILESTLQEDRSACVLVTNGCRDIR